MSAKPVFAMFCAAGALFVAAGCASSGVRGDLKANGITYELRKMQNPRPNRVHVLRVDFSKGNLEMAVRMADDPDGAGPAEATLTNPLKLAQDPSLVCCVNANPWDALPDAANKKNRNWYEGQPVDILGLAVSGERMRSRGDGRVAVWADTRNHLSVGTPPADGSVFEGVGGFTQIVKSATISVPHGGPVHPRTAIGVNRTGSIMFLVVVDGRQPGYSEGMTVEELACVMRDLGCWDAANMDGGGSSVMALIDHDRQLQVINSPSDRNSADPATPRIRPIPVILTIKYKSASDSSARVAEQNTKH